MTELPDFFNASVLVVGDIMLDYYIWGEVDRISPEAPIPVVHVQNRTWRLGGAGNVALNLVGLECKTKLIGIIGKDRSGSQVKDLMATAGIADLSFCIDYFPTITKTRVMGGGQQIVRIDDEQPALIDDTARYCLYSLFENEIFNNRVDVVVISDYGKGLFSDVLLEKCISLCTGKSVPVFIDPKRPDWKAYADATCITPNILEFQKACDFMRIDSADLEAAGKKLIDLYNLDYLLITRGSKGISLLKRGDTMYTIPAQAREVFDVSGAGDTVVALMAAGMSVGLDMKRTTALANLAAGEVVARIGTYAIQKLDLIRALLAREQGNLHTLSGVDLYYARKIVEIWKFLGKQIVFTNGCFDILHPGHVHFLQQAKKFGDKLLVGMNTDDSIKRIKGPSRPVINQDDRSSILNALGCVDLVVFFSEDTPLNLIAALQPDVIVKGDDYRIEQVTGADMLEKWGGRVELVQLLVNKSTTDIIEKILNCNDISFELASRKN